MKIRGEIVMNPQIFREYDIRGLVEKDLTPDVVESIGKAYGTYMKRAGLTNLVVGGDVRLSSPKIKGELIKGINSTGCNVLDIGICPTPVFYHSIIHFKKNGGVHVTGSHNPKEFNGFKICKGVPTIHGEEVQKLRKMIEANDYETGLDVDENNATGKAVFGIGSE